MKVIGDIFEKLDNFLSSILAPIINKIIAFLSSGDYTIIGVVCFFASLIILVGLIRWLTKKPKLFIFIIIILGIIVGARIISK